MENLLWRPLMGKSRKKKRRRRLEVKLIPLSVPTKYLPGKSVHVEKRLSSYNMQNTGQNPAGQNPYGQNPTRQTQTQTLRLRNIYLTFESYNTASCY